MGAGDGPPPPGVGRPCLAPRAAGCAGHQTARRQWRSVPAGWRARRGPSRGGDRLPAAPGRPSAPFRRRGFSRAVGICIAGPPPPQTLAPIVPGGSRRRRAQGPGRGAARGGAGTGCGGRAGQKGGVQSREAAGGREISGRGGGTRRRVCLPRDSRRPPLGTPTPCLIPLPAGAAARCDGNPNGGGGSPAFPRPGPERRSSSGHSSQLLAQEALAARAQKHPEAPGRPRAPIQLSV